MLLTDKTSDAVALMVIDLGRVWGKWEKGREVSLPPAKNRRKGFACSSY